MPAPSSGPRDNGDGTTPTPSPQEIHDPLAELEAIRAVLNDAHFRLGRMAAAMKQHRRQARAVQAAVQSLRQIPQLTP
jgi:hypothetical protein